MDIPSLDILTIPVLLRGYAAKVGGNKFEPLLPGCCSAASVATNMRHTTNLRHTSRASLRCNLGELVSAYHPLVGGWNIVDLEQAYNNTRCPRCPPASAVRLKRSVRCHPEDMCHSQQGKSFSTIMFENTRVFFEQGRFAMSIHWPGRRRSSHEANRVA